MPRWKGLRWQLSRIRKQEVVVLRTWDLPGWGSSEAGGGPGVGLLGGVGRDRARAEGWCGRGQGRGWTVGGLDAAQSQRTGF